MSPEAVHAILADLERRADRIAVRADGRETWRFRVDDAGPLYDLHFYPDDDTALKRYLGGADAAREFTQLQALQKLTIPATRVIANLKGLRVATRKGDACIVVHDPAAVPLDDLLCDADLWPHRERLAKTASFLERLESLHREKLCPTPLLAHGFSMREDITLLADGSATLRGTVDADRLTELDASTRHVTTRAERLRIWRHFRGDETPPAERVLAASATRVMRDAVAGDGWFGAIEHGGWSGRFLRKPMLTLPWSAASRVLFSREDWLAALPAILDATGGESIKADAAASVIGRAIKIGGRTFDVVLKRPTFKPGLRGLYRSYRRSRAMRAWVKTWRMLAMGFACEVPLLVMEKRRALRVVEQMLIVERVPGPTLAAAKLDAMQQRERVMYDAGRVLRLVERAGFSHWDAKSTNWIVWTSRAGRDMPVLIDLDGIRFYRARGLGARRLLRALREHPEVQPTDLAAIAAGYHGPNRSS